MNTTRRAWSLDDGNHGLRIVKVDLRVSSGWLAVLGLYRHSQEHDTEVSYLVERTETCLLRADPLTCMRNAVLRAMGVRSWSRRTLKLKFSGAAVVSLSLLGVVQQLACRAWDSRRVGMVATQTREYLNMIGALDISTIHHFFQE